MAPAYIFSLDGTLIDSAPHICSAVNEILVGDGRTSIVTADIPFLIGNGSRVLLERAFAKTGTIPEADRFEPLYRDFMGAYARHQIQQSRPYPGVGKTLEELRHSGVRLAVLTNKPQELAEQLLAQLYLTKYFAVIYGGGKHPYLKPDPRLFAEILIEIGGRGPAVMIGDSLPDVELARNAKVPSILVSYGYCVDLPESLGADAIVDSFADIPAVADKLLSVNWSRAGC